MRYIIIFNLLVLLLAGCSTSRLPSPRDLPFIHKIDVQQGNVVTQEMVAQLRPGMDEKKVQFIMGTPIIKDTFNDKRWDYIYTFEYGGGHTERRHVTLNFEDDKLASVNGDVKPAEGDLVVALHQDRAVKVPSLKKRSFVTRMKAKIPFVEEPQEEVVEILPGEEAPELTPEQQAEEDSLVYEFEPLVPTSPYADIQSAPGEGIIVPPDAPRVRKKKGFFSRLFDGIGLGAEEEEEDPDYNPNDRRYRDITDQDDV